jgi:molybdate transport system permease protein
MTTRPTDALSTVLASALALLLGVLLGAPLVALVASTSLTDLAAAASAREAGQALRLSLATSFASVALVVAGGTPLAWWLARSEGRGARLVEVLALVPIVLPPSVAGVALLLAFGRHGPLGGWLGSLAFTTPAVVLAETFVAAPFFVLAATSAFRRIDPRVLLVARTLGASGPTVFARVAVPIAAPGLIAGAAMTWARALGEFGATLMFAGNMEGRTQTLPLAIYTAFESDLGVARALSVLLVVVALAVLVGVRRLERTDERAA